MKSIMKESKRVALLYTILGLVMIGFAFVSGFIFYGYVGLGIALAGIIIAQGMKIRHIIKILQQNGLWTDQVFEKEKKKKIEEKNATELLDKEDQKN